MRFLFLTQYFAPEVGAPQVRLAAVTRELVKSGHQVEVVTTLPSYPHSKIFPEYRGSLYVQEDCEGIVVHRVWSYASLGAGIGRLVNYLSFSVTALAGLSRAHRPDLIVVESPPLLLGLSAIMFSRIWRVPVIFNVSDLWPDTAREFDLIGDGVFLSFAHKLEAWLYRESQFVCAITEGVREALMHKKGVSRRKLLFLPNGADTNLYRPMTPDMEWKARLGLEGKRILLYAGTQGYAHGVEKFLHAAKRLEGTNLHFLFVGGGSAKSGLAELARRLKLTNVTYMDPVPSEDIPRLLSISLCGLVSVRNCPILDGARPAKMIATMSCATPVIYAGDGEGARLLREAGGGVVISSEDPDAIAKGILVIAEDPELAWQMGKNGRAYVEKHLSWTLLVSNWLDQLTAGDAAYGDVHSRTSRIGAASGATELT
jgi:glycosyltransferase involved in cell wall biosynthesis